MNGIYSKKGDNMETELFGGQKIFKSSQRIETYGTMDELNSILGVVASDLKHNDIKDEILEIQNHLHIICAEIANPDEKKEGIVKEDYVTYLEKLCDKHTQELEPLKKFILPGGTAAGATLHFARTVARRAEREIVRLSTMSTVNPEILKYINRLADLLFIFSRLVNKREGKPETSPKY
ncbi:MAG: cob(I)yrinic acid a,c-diamide adenosyltransferase [Candidatus Aenigmatarchaeota archaeon]|nr:cob(I)yrinic acid a,c-diamide adenosyltransferase [Nanoarchaeota archaeon]